MLLPTIKIKNQADLGKAVDMLLDTLKTGTDDPRKLRDVTFATAVLSRLARFGLGLAATGAEGEKAQESVADAYLSMLARDAAAALGYEMKDPIK